MRKIRNGETEVIVEFRPGSLWALEMKGIKSVLAGGIHLPAKPRQRRGRPRKVKVYSQPEVMRENVLRGFTSPPFTTA